jgi:hypothetical protein
MTKSLGLTLALLALVLGVTALHPTPVLAQQATGESLITGGDTIAVYVDAEDFEALKGKSVGAKVTLKVLDNVDRFGSTLITKYTPVYCTVTKRSRGGMYGSAGKMMLQIDSTHSTAGTNIPLKGEAQFKGKGKKTVAFILFPFGWLIKGKDIQFPEGHNVFKPVVTQDTPLEYLR